MISSNQQEQFKKTNSMNLIIENPLDQTKGNLWLGSYDAVRNHEDLEKYGIKVILSIVDCITVNLPERLKIEQHTFQAVDDNSHNIYPLFDKTFDLIDNGLQKGNVLVHCAAGISRSSTIVIAYMIRKFKQNFDETYEFVHKRRNQAYPNMGFREQLKKYQELYLNK